MDIGWVEVLSGGRPLGVGEAAFGLVCREVILRKAGLFVYETRFLRFLGPGLWSGS